MHGQKQNPTMVAGVGLLATMFTMPWEVISRLVTRLFSSTWLSQGFQEMTYGGAVPPSPHQLTHHPLDQGQHLLVCLPSWQILLGPTRHQANPSAPRILNIPSWCPKAAPETPEVGVCPTEAVLLQDNERELL